MTDSPPAPVSEPARGRPLMADEPLTPAECAERPTFDDLWAASCAIPVPGYPPRALARLIPRSPS